MGRSLYAKLMWVFMAVLLVAMATFSLMLYQRIREDKIDARLDELTAQARDIAYLAAQRTLFGSAQTDRYITWKSKEVMEDFDAYILILDSLGNIIPIGDQSTTNTYDLTLEETLDYLNRVVAGEEIRVRMMPYAGTVNPVFTVGVPFVQDGRVLGAVFIHTSEQSIAASYTGIVGQAARTLLLSVTIGALMILAASQYITSPLREMARAADRFAQGDFDQRVSVQTHDEIGRLAEAFNSMAHDLEQLEQTRRAFVANVSHELRSPLTSMQGFINGILDGTIPESEHEHYLSIVLDETRRLNKLISALLDLSHIESGKAPLTKSRFDLNEMILRVLARQEATLTERHIDVVCDFQEGACMVNADADRIEQVLINLIDNAIKYMDVDEGRITLFTRAEGQVARVAVSDNGRGIAEEDLSHIFERFYKADKAHTTGQGTGLGLSIVKSIIEQHGREIAATRAEGGGARFEFTLDRV